MRDAGWAGGGGGAGPLLSLLTLPSPGAPPVHRELGTLAGAR